MAKRDAEYFEMVKKTVIAMGGHVSNSAVALGMRVDALSRMLNHRGLVEWWVPYKDKLVFQRMKARNKRAYREMKRRQLAAQGLDPDLFYPR